MSIVRQNVLLMQSEMQKMIGSESVGYGVHREGGKKYPTAGANFVCERATGKIVLFSLPQYLPPELKKLLDARQLWLGVFKVAVNPGQKFVKIIFAHYGAGVPFEARKVLDASVAEYNACIGW